MSRIPFWFFILTALLYFCAVGVDTMDVDASQYAEMSREMLQSSNYLHVYDRGFDYLDKPPFLFWVNALSMKALGVNNFSYKLPSILFALLALYSTYRLARLLYNEQVGRIAAVVLATCQGMFLMTNDVRCDTILMAWVITATWLIQEWVVNRRLLFLLAGCAAIAFGMMTKGPIALMVPVFGFVSNWALKREWKNFLQPAYLSGLVVIAVLLIPMSIGLYQQFDAHPEKTVNGLTGVSGLRFFYWSQSFGRITGESPWNNNAGITFLLENMLWSFLPWIFLLLPAIALNIISLIRRKFRLLPHEEWITTGGFLLSYLALGSSAYQLPHYIFVAFPFAAIITARLLYDLIENKQYPRLYKFMSPFLYFITFLLFVLAGILITYIFPAHPLFLAGWGAGAAILLYTAFKKKITGKLIWVPACGIAMVNIFVSLHVYPSLLKYEVGAVAGRYLHQENIPAEKVSSYKMEDPLNAIHFYAQGIIRDRPVIDTAEKGSYYLLMEPGIHELNEKGIRFNIVKEGRFFKVSELTPEFLDPKTRDKATKQYYLIKLL